MQTYNLVKFYQFVLQDIERKRDSDLKGHNCYKYEKMTHNNPNLDLVNINACYTNFSKIIQNLVKFYIEKEIMMI